jgi:threonine dehydratase
VVCASAGNLGQALAWSGRGRRLDVTVVASRFAPAAKLDRIRALDARLELVDGDFDMARERAADIATCDGIRLVEDSLDIETCEGAATIGLELADATTPFDAVLVALGGGALATGVGHVLKALMPEVEMICVQPRGAPAMTLSWRQRRVVTTGSTDTIADGVAGRRPNPAVHDDLLRRRRRSSLACGCSSGAPASSPNRRPRSASRRSSKTVTASPAGAWSPSCAAAMST